MTPPIAPYEERVEYGIYGKRTGGYYVKISIKGYQRKHPVDTLEEARQLRDELVAERDRNTPDRLPPIHQPQEGEPVATEAPERDEVEEVELPEPVRIARDQLAAERDRMNEEAEPLRARLRDLEQGMERIQQAIDALEGREPDASAEFRQPGALKDRLPEAVRAGFRAPERGRKNMSREEGLQLRATVLDVLPFGESNAIGRTEIAQFASVKFGRQVKKEQAGRMLSYLQEDGLARRSDPANPRDIVWWRSEQTD